MDRFHNKPIIKSFYPVSQFSKTECDNFRCWFYPLVNVEGFTSLILTKYEEIDLPTMDVYRVHANAENGQVVGFSFDCITKYFNYGPNFLICYAGAFASYRDKDLQSRLKLRYRVKDINLYAIDGRVSQATIPWYKDELDF